MRPFLSSSLNELSLQDVGRPPREEGAWPDLTDAARVRASASPLLLAPPLACATALLLVLASSVRASGPRARLLMSSAAKPPVTALLSTCKLLCDDMSATLVKDVYSQIAMDRAKNTMAKADSSYFSLADGVVQVQAKPAYHTCHMPCL